MFDLAWSEIALIGVVALVVIGPKDLPEAIRGVAKGVQKLRRMAAEFQTHADELVREAKLDEVRNQINDVKSAVNEIRNFDLRGTVEKTVDGDGIIRSTFDSDPFKTAPAWAPPPVTEPPPAMMEGASAGMAAAPPAFVPPDEAAKVIPLPAPAPEPPAPSAEAAPVPAAAAVKA
jgi:sec-independent protein translocase protein TatB